MLVLPGQRLLAQSVLVSCPSLSLTICTLLAVCHLHFLPSHVPSRTNWCTIRYLSVTSHFTSVTSPALTISHLCHFLSRACHFDTHIEHDCAGSQHVSFRCFFNCVCHTTPLSVSLLPTDAALLPTPHPGPAVLASHLFHATQSCPRG